MIRFQPATESDTGTLRTLAESIWRESYAEMISPAQIAYMLAWMYSAETIRREIAEGVCWEIVQLGDKDIGYLAVTFVPGGVAKLDKLYLRAAHQAKGLGQAVLAHIFDLATNRGTREVRLQVNKGNFRAQRAYERFGFVRLGESVCDIGGGYVMDDYLLAKSVAPFPSGDTFSV